MKPVEFVVSKLQPYPHVTYKLDGGGNDGIHIDPPNPGGFAVSLVNDDPRWIVSAGDQGGHWHFENAEEALELLAFCMSEDCRLKVEERTFQIRSTLEMQTDGGWAMARRTGVLTIRLRKPWTVAIFQNKLIPARGQIPR